MWVFGIGVVALLALGVWGWRKVQSLSSDQKMAIKDGINDVFLRAEARGVIPAAPAFDLEYASTYPEFRILEENHKVIREECEKLLGIKDKMTDMEALGGGYTSGGVHTVQWKTFMFKSGSFIEENCRLAPKTADLLRRVPSLYTAFFSVLDPHQHIEPHFGYYKGFLRYHIGVIIPHDNADGCCWLRVNANLEDNAQRDRSLIEKGETYYWRNGEGVMFDDTFLHEAQNESDEVRVVLFLDVARKMPWYLNAFNKLVLWVVHQEGSVKRIREQATLDL
jgi:beta-hydroxylase